MSLVVSCLLFTAFAFQTVERQRKECNLSKRKRLQSIGFSLQLCFHTAVEAGCGALMNDTLMFPSLLPPLLILCSWGLSLRWVGAPGWVWGTRTVLSSLLCRQSTAVHFVTVDFSLCRGFAGGKYRKVWSFWELHLLNYPPLSGTASRGGGKQLTYGPEKYMTAVFRSRKELECLPENIVIHKCKPCSVPTISFNSEVEDTVRT